MSNGVNEEGMDQYLRLAKELHMLDAMLISPQKIHFDIRAILKCRWGCEGFSDENIRCQSRGTTYPERVEMVKKYSHILLVHSHDARELSEAVLEIEKRAFLDGYYFAFALRTCNLCPNCLLKKGNACPAPDRVRPCEQSFGIDVYKTVRNLGFSCNVLLNREAIQNRYGFVLID